MKQVVDKFDPHQIKNAIALRKIEETAKKLVMHAVNIEYAMKMLNDLRMRTKLMALGNATDPEATPVPGGSTRNHYYLCCRSVDPRTGQMGAGKTAGISWVLKWLHMRPITFWLMNPSPAPTRVSRMF